MSRTCVRCSRIVDEWSKCENTDCGLPRAGDEAFNAPIPINPRTKEPYFEIPAEGWWSTEKVKS